MKKYQWYIEFYQEMQEEIIKLYDTDPTLAKEIKRVIDRVKESLFMTNRVYFSEMNALYHGKMLNLAEVQNQIKYFKEREENR